MSMNGKFLKLAVTSAATCALLLTGCTKKPNEEQLNQLDDARGAAISAETTKSQKIEERRKLEQQVNAKKGVLAEHEAERDDVKQKMEERNQ